MNCYPGLKKMRGHRLARAGGCDKLQLMTKTVKRASANPKKVVSFKIGRQASAAISRVEGLVVSKDMARTFEGMEKSGMSNAAKRAALKGKYGKAG